MTAFLAGSGPRAFAHRGWHIDDLAGCENSMAAFVRAVDEGFQYLETDVHVTSDGELIAFHDSRLDRVTDGHGFVRRLPWTTVREAKIGGREAIPRFEQVLELLRDRPGVRLNIDPKSDGAVGPLVDAVRSSGSADRVCIGSFSDTRLRGVSAALGPQVATSLGPRGIARLFTDAQRGRRLVSSAVAAQVPVQFRGLRVVTPRFVEAAHSSGLEVHVWTIDDAAEMSRLLDMGVDGIMTDRPDVLRRVLVDRRQWQ